MENYNIKAIKEFYYKPEIILDAETGKCSITGDSYLEDPLKFYLPVIEWLKKYIAEIKRPIEFNFKVEYFNTSSFRSFIDIITILKEYKDNGGAVIINWYVEEDDEDLKEDIEDFVLRTNMEINQVIIKPE
ncbi:MAG: DUF1987 domain-containing protein [Bacteroidia bacterium]|nr:DUF1987 domain-containing protein [Bacteroidia bacterium]